MKNQSINSVVGLWVFGLVVPYLIFDYVFKNVLSVKEKEKDKE
ncbi:MAG: hypothetical protein QXW48_03925 [Thermoplasmata archaeon]